MTKNSNSGRKDHTLQSQVNPKVYKVVTSLNNKIEILNKRGLNRVRVNKITPEEARWIQRYVETQDIREASMYAYGDKIKNKYHARNMGLVKMEKPMIKKAIGDIMEYNEKLQPDKVMEQYTKLLYSENEMVSKDMVKEYFKIKGVYAPEKHINANADLTSYSDEEFISETLGMLEDGDERGKKNVLDEISLRDPEETRED